MEKSSGAMFTGKDACRLIGGSIFRLYLEQEKTRKIAFVLKYFKGRVSVFFILSWILLDLKISSQKASESSPKTECRTLITQMPVCQISTTLEARTPNSNHPRSQNARFQPPQKVECQISTTPRDRRQRSEGNRKQKATENERR